MEKMPKEFPLVDRKGVVEEEEDGGGRDGGGAIKVNIWQSIVTDSLFSAIHITIVDTRCLIY